MQIANRTKLILSSSAFTFPVGLVIAALATYRVDDVELARILLAFAVTIGLLGLILSDWTSARGWLRIVTVALISLVVFGVSAWRLDSWAIARAAQMNARMKPASVPVPAPPAFALDKAIPSPILPRIRTGKIQTGNNSNVAIGATQSSKGNLSPNIIGNDNRVGTTELSIPEPYFGQSSQVVGQWTIKEANTLQELADTCQRDFLQGMKNKQDGRPFDQQHFGPELPLVRFLSEFELHHKEFLEKLHASLSYRLGPDVIGDEDFKRIDEFQEHGSHLSIGFQCMAVQRYAPELLQMGQSLLSRENDPTLSTETHQTVDRATAHAQHHKPQDNVTATVGGPQVKGTQPTPPPSKP